MLDPCGFGSAASASTVQWLETALAASQVLIICLILWALSAKAELAHALADLDAMRRGQPDGEWDHG